MLGSNAAFMWREQLVKYADIDLSADEIHMDMKESGICRRSKDTTDEVVGRRCSGPQRRIPVENHDLQLQDFKGFITDVVAQQGEDTLPADRQRKLADDSYNIISSRYTTCDDHETTLTSTCS